MTKFLSRRIALLNEFYFFRIAFILGDLFNVSFLYIFLFNKFSSLEIIIVFEIILLFGLLVGYVLGSFILEKIGYIGNFRLSFFIVGVSQIILALSINNLDTFIMLISLFFGIGRGIYWSTININKIKEFSTDFRGSAISNSITIQLVLGIIFAPLIGGYLSSSGDYLFIFLIGGTILLAAILLPWKYNKKIKNKTMLSEYKSLLANKHYINYAVLISIKSGFEVITNLIFFILPFLLLKTEFSVGVLAAIVNIIAVLLTFTFRKSKITQTLKLTRTGNTLNGIANLLLIVFWNVPGLLVRGLGVLIGNAIRLPAEDKIETKMREIILKDKVNQSAIEINLLSEIFLFTGRFAFLSLFLILTILVENMETAMRIILVFSSIWVLIYTPLIMRVHRKMKELDTIPLA